MYLETRAPDGAAAAQDRFAKALHDPSMARQLHEDAMYSNAVCSDGADVSTLSLLHKSSSPHKFTGLTGTTSCHLPPACYSVHLDPQLAPRPLIGTQTLNWHSVLVEWSCRDAQAGSKTADCH